MFTSSKTARSTPESLNWKKKKRERTSISELKLKYINSFPIFYEMREAVGQVDWIFCNGSL